MTHQDFSTSLFSAELGIEKEVQHSFSKMNCERGCRNWRCVHLHSIVTRNSDISHANELIKHSTWRLVHCLSAAPLENRQKLQAHRNYALDYVWGLFCFKSPQLSAACVRAVIDTPSSTPPSSDWLFWFGCVGFLQMALWPLEDATGAWFYQSHVLLTVSANMTKVLL